MRINFLVTLNDKEKELMLAQCKREFAQAYRLYEEFRLRYRESKDLAFDRMLFKANQWESRALAICDIIAGMGLEIREKFNINGRTNSCGIIEFYERFPPRKERFDERNPYYKKLAIYIMCRAGIITKETRGKILSMYKEQGALKQAERIKAKSERVNRIYRQFMYDLGKILPTDEVQEIWMKTGVQEYIEKKFRGYKHHGTTKENKQN